jgi:hypothetical protein
MVETRAAHRYRVTKPAQIEYGGDKIACSFATYQLLARRWRYLTHPESLQNSH